MLWERVDTDWQGASQDKCEPAQCDITNILWFTSIIRKIIIQIENNKIDRKCYYQHKI